MLIRSSTPLRSVALTTFALLASAVSGAPLPVRHMHGFTHGFVVLKDSDDKILASGDVTQTPAGNRLTGIMTLRFKDGSLYQATTVFSQRRIFQLLKYKQVRKGPSFKTDETLSLDTASGNVNIQYIDKDGKTKNISDRLSLPPDLANGMIPTLMGDIDPKAETTLSMLVSTPKPRVVRLKISALDAAWYSPACQAKPRNTLSKSILAASPVWPRRSSGSRRRLSISGLRRMSPLFCDQTGRYTKTGRSGA